jgi:hypothetical protein
MKMNKMLIGITAVLMAAGAYAADRNWASGDATAGVPAGTFAGGVYSQDFYWDASNSKTAITTNDTATVMTLPANAIIWGATLNVLELFTDGATNATPPAHTIDVGYNGTANTFFNDVSLTNLAVSAKVLAPYDFTATTVVYTNVVYAGGATTGNVSLVSAVTTSEPLLTTSNGTPVTIAITAASRGDNPRKGKLKLRVVYTWLGGE